MLFITNFNAMLILVLSCGIFFLRKKVEEKNKNEKIDDVILEEIGVLIICIFTFLVTNIF